MAEPKRMTRVAKTTKVKPVDEYGHLQPQAPELEEVVLGALMIEKDAYPQVSEILRPESFYEHRHQLIYAAITDLAIQQKPIDILTVAEQLRLRGELEEAGGPFYITQLSGKVASSAHIEYHARIIAQKFLARELISFTSNIQTKAFDETQDVDDLMQEAEGRLFEMAPVYLAKELPIKEHPHERQTLCIGAFGPEEDFFTVKGALEALAAGFGLSFDYKRETTPWLHPGISAAVYCGDKRLGVFGKLSNEINGELEIAKDQKDSQNIYLGELDYEALMSCVDGELRYQPLSPYAAVKRDLALVCDEKTTCGEIEETIKKASPLVGEIKLFDIYRGANLGEGKKSMAFTLSLSDPKKEVSAEEVERVVKKILGNLKFKLGIEIR